jgi:hypothetical protein
MLTPTWDNEIYLKHSALGVAENCDSLYHTVIKAEHNMCEDYGRSESRILL